MPVVEVLNRGLQKLMVDGSLNPFSHPNGSPLINNLSFVDDTIIFCNGAIKSLKCLLKFLKRYEKASGQVINFDKSSFTIHESVNRIRRKNITSALNLKHKDVPLKYLGCPIFYDRAKHDYFEDIINKIKKEDSRLEVQFPLFSW